MHFFPLNAFDCFAALSFLYLLVQLRDHRRRGGLPYPPGPPLWPIIGNLLDIPRDLAWRAYADMSNKYGKCNVLVDTSSPSAEPALQGDIICFRIYPVVVIFLCSPSAIKDLFEKRGQTFSERPTLPIAEMYVYSVLIFQSTAMSTILYL
jgi:hypothetical protein